MNYRSIAHVAVCVTDLKAAELLYCELFGLEVAFREARTTDGWASLPPGAGWKEAEASGLHLELVFLRREGFEFALERLAQSPGEPSRLSHIALEVSQEELEGLRSRARDQNCAILYDKPTTIMFSDPNGVRWEIMLRSDSRSTGERTGKWLDVKQS